jgi:hypothetical protein
MPDDEQKGEVEHVCIFECLPQGDNSDYNVYHEISAEELDDYENAKDIVGVLLITAVQRLPTLYSY